MRSTKRVALGTALLMALSLAGPPASARHSRHEHADGGPDERDERDEAASPGKASMAAHDDDLDDDDGGAPLVVHRTTEQSERRDQLLRRERGLVHNLWRGGGRMEPRERQAIGLHWRYVMRLFRIRELAEEDHDKVTVASVDALIERADKKFNARMDELRAPVGRMDAGAR